MALFSMAVFIILVRILHTPVAATVETELCVEAISTNPGTIAYLDANIDMPSQSIEHFDDEIMNETVVVIVNITAPSTDHGNNSRVYIYQIGRIFWAGSVSPELIDLMTFKTINLVKRTQQLSLDVRTFDICGNKSWKTLLLHAFTLDKVHGFVSLIQPNNQTSSSIVITSGMLVFPFLALTSTLVVLAVRFVFEISDSAENSIHHRLFDSSGAFATMNAIEVGLFALYISYIAFGVLSYYNNLHGVAALLLDRYVVAPFTSNALSILSMVTFSPFASCLLFNRNHGPSTWTRICTACSVTLTTVLVYHSPFFLFVLIQDFVSAFTSLLIRITVVVSAYIVLILFQHAKPAIYDSLHFILENCKRGNQVCPSEKPPVIPSSV